jgi:hypothetical protein
MAAVPVAEMTEIRLARLESDVAHIRSDVADVKIDLREMRRDFGGLHDEMRKEFAILHQELAAGREAMIRGDLMTRISMLLMCAAMLGVMARGLHWL